MTFVVVVLIPALVAALVTLVIEYVAKPYLEVRKDQITERYADMREVARLAARPASR